jgi:hypothetical protein
MCLPALAAVYYVDPKNGDDSYPGTSAESPWQGLAKVNGSTFLSGDSILLKRGEAWEEDLSLSSSGASSDPITVGAYGVGDAPLVRALTVYGDYIIVEDLTVDGDKGAKDAVRIRGARNCVLRGLTIRNGTKDGIDVSRAENLLIDTCHIHHFLAGSFTGQQDAHGIVVNRSQGITVRNTEIHHVSGDSFQADPSRDLENLTNDILLENCHFWTGPLREDFNGGWVRTEHLPEDQKQYPGENAVDTKVLKSGWENISRMRITIRNISAHGWKKDNFIPNKAVFNLKENIEAVIDGVTVYGSEIAFRIRGTRGNANVTIKNAVIYNCDKAIRAEDNLENLQVYNSTFGHLIKTEVEFAGGSGGTASWKLLNNAFIDSKPAVANGQSNVAVLSRDSNADFVDYTTGNYHLKTDSSLIEVGETLAHVASDRDGSLRTSPYDVGAYELSTNSHSLSPPAPPKNLEIKR